MNGKGPNKRRGEKGRNISPSGTRRFDAKRKKRYAEVLAQCGNRGEACAAIGVHVLTVSQHETRDPEFHAMCEEARALYRGVIEKEIHRRAVKGVLKPVYWKGAVAGRIREYSDRLLIALAKRHIKEYRDKVTIEQTSTTAEGLVDLDKLSPEAQDMLRKVLEEQLRIVEGKSEDRET